MKLTYVPSVGYANPALCQEVSIERSQLYLPTCIKSATPKIGYVIFTTHLKDI